MQKHLTLALVVFFTAACSPSERAVTAAVKESLKDPDSARFGDFSLSKEGTQACIAVNAKNSYGGYVGERQYYAFKEPSSKDWKSFIDSNESHQSCAEMVNILERKHFTSNKWPSDTSVGIDDVSAIHDHKTEFEKRSDSQ